MLSTRTYKVQASWATLVGALSSIREFAQSAQAVRDVHCAQTNPKITYMIRWGQWLIATQRRWLVSAISVRVQPKQGPPVHQGILGELVEIFAGAVVPALAGRSPKQAARQL